LQNPKPARPFESLVKPPALPRYGYIASGKLAELEGKARFVEEIHGAYGGE
jgi:hypothetical protein